jgi:membrane fusion protein, copper/silver efflux system
MNLNAMTPKYWLLVIVVVVLVAAAGGYWLAKYGSHDMAAADSPADREVLYWHDPMVPGARFDKPGKSPFMDMQLVPVYADEAGSDTGVRVPANVTQNLGIRVGKVEAAMFDRALAVVGSVAFDERLLAVVPARVEGYATRLFVRSPLERVRRGQPLAEIQAPAWLEAQQEYLALLDAQSESAQGLRDAARRRMRILGVPESTIKRIESDRKPLATTTITSPIDGVISELGIREGAAFMPGTPLFRVNGLTTVWVNARIPETNVSLVTPGSTVSAYATAWPGVSFEGRVVALLPEVDAQTRTLTARVELKNPDAQLAPGMFVSLQFSAPNREPQLMVPSEAVIQTGARSVVVVVNGDGSFGVANVITGGDADGRTAILNGLNEGQPIVLSGQFLIDSEASLKSAVTRLGAGEPSTAPAKPNDTSPTSQLHTAEGTITAIDDSSITLEHGAVPSLDWSPMTMEFRKPARGVPPELQVGDRVNFSFKQVVGGFQIESIAKSNGASEHPGHQR